MEYTLDASKPRVRDVADNERTALVRFTDNGVGWVGKHGGTGDGLILELLDKSGNSQGVAIINQADILALARALK